MGAVVVLTGLFLFPKAFINRIGKPARAIPTDFSVYMLNAFV